MGSGASRNKPNGTVTDCGNNRSPSVGSPLRSQPSNTSMTSVVEDINKDCTGHTRGTASPSSDDQQAAVELAVGDDTVEQPVDNLSPSTNHSENSSMKYQRLRERFLSRRSHDDDQEEEEEQSPNQQNEYNGDNFDDDAGEVFAHTALSLGMDNDDLLFNLMYFEGMSSLSSMVNTIQQETVALHSENNTPYKLKPASESAISALRHQKYAATAEEMKQRQNNLDERECAVCKDEFECDDAVIRLPICKHIFHEGCLLRWVKLQGWCPVCRTDLTHVVSMDQSHEQNNSLDAISTCAHNNPCNSGIASCDGRPDSSDDIGDKRTRQSSSKSSDFDHISDTSSSTAKRLEFADHAEKRIHSDSRDEANGGSTVAIADTKVEHASGNCDVVK